MNDEHATAEQPTYLRRIRRSLVGALVLMALDEALLGSFLFSLLVCPLWLLVSFVKAVIQRPAWEVGLARVLVPAMTLGLVLGNATLQSRMATSNARRIVTACERFRETQDRYPDELDELVPSYMSSLPRAKYSLAFGEFSYWSQAGRHSLAWTAVPPFGRRVYDLEQRVSIALD